MFDKTAHMRTKYKQKAMKRYNEDAKFREKMIKLGKSEFYENLDAKYSDYTIVKEPYDNSVRNLGFVNCVPTRLYRIWSDMKQRCTNPNSRLYKYYGAKGVSVSKEWGKYVGFYNWAQSSGYADNLTIDRIDANGNYEPGNCQWLTKSENTRKAHLGIKETSKTKS